VSDTPVDLAGWLAHCERLHPVGMDLGLDRVEAVRARLGLSFAHTTLVVVGGTNGKGSTCALIESIARAAGYRTGVFSKPHLVRFEERCRVDGVQVAGEMLVPHFAAVEAARAGTTLTYFEFTLLAIARHLASLPLDLVVLEVGLGGRLDAVNVFDADCAVLTSIAVDHVAQLGPDRESIGREKAGILRAGRPAVVGDPEPPARVLATAERLGADLRLAGRDFRTSGDRLQWNWVGRTQRFSGLAYPALRGTNQLLNAAAALACFEALADRVPIPAQAVRLGLATVELPGRFQVLAGQPTVVLDVGHNPHAVATLAVDLDRMGFHPRTFAVFGVMGDKDLDAILERIAPLVDAWHVTDLPLPRAATAATLAAHLRGRVPREARTVEVHEHPSPAEAFAAAKAAADPADRIVVFGSFLTVGGVLESLARR
jgi:dihydrofolate synthase/folylpolyglutamate synthase